LARTFGPHPRDLALPRPATPDSWLTAARPFLSSTAGLLLGVALLGGAVLQLPSEPAAPIPLPAAAAPALPIVLESAAAVTESAAPLVVPNAPPAAAATEAPDVTAAPAAPPAPVLSAASYRASGRAYAAISADVGATLESPIAGRVEVRLYQLINGEIRVGANVPTLAFFPYVVVRSSDRVLTLRPGALNIDSEVLVRDGSTVSAGTPLVRVIGSGASSWRTFYDRNLQAQVVASLTTAGGADLDAVPVFTRH
jgi:hypothetical protein